MNWLFAALLLFTPSQGVCPGPSGDLPSASACYVVPAPVVRGERLGRGERRGLGEFVRDDVRVR